MLTISNTEDGVGVMAVQHHRCAVLIPLVQVVKMVDFAMYDLPQFSLKLYCHGHCRQRSTRRICLWKFNVLSSDGREAVNDPVESRAARQCRLTFNLPAASRAFNAFLLL